MNELLVVFYVMATIAIAYLWVYPQFAGGDVRKLARLDVAITLVPVSISALLFWESNPPLRFFFFDTHWFFFTVLTMVVFELPLFYFYLKARGLSFSSMAFGSAGDWASVSPQSVEKQLNDTKWDGLRTRAARMFLFWGSNLAILGGTVVLWLVGENPWALYVLIHVLILLVFWYLLRQSVRLVADAPEEILDERLLTHRNRSHVIAFRWLSALAVAVVTAMMTYFLFGTRLDGFSYIITPSWTQVQAVFWLVMAYSTMLPSMAMMYLELKRPRMTRERELENSD